MFLTSCSEFFILKTSVKSQFDLCIANRITDSRSTNALLELSARVEARVVEIRSEECKSSILATELYPPKLPPHYPIVLSTLLIKYDFNSEMAREAKSKYIRTSLDVFNFHTLPGSNRHQGAVILNGNEPFESSNDKIKIKCQRVDHYTNPRLGFHPHQATGQSILVNILIRERSKMTQVILWLIPNVGFEPTSLAVFCAREWLTVISFFSDNVSACFRLHYRH